MFGVWMPQEGVPLKSILGPLSYNFLASHSGAFSALRDKRTNEVWFTLLWGQAFRVRGNQMQYCFGEGLLLEQSPFSVNSTSSTDVTFCWRTGLRGMPTQALHCSGCDCARIHISLIDTNSLHFQFWMSGPVPHADLHLVRYKPEPSFDKAIVSAMLFPYRQCRFVDHYGPNVPGEPNLRPHERLPRGGCAHAGSSLVKRNQAIDRLVDKTTAVISAEEERGGGRCRQLNGLNFLIDSHTPVKQAMNVPDVRFQFTPPKGDCNPCDVSYSISAKIAEDEYIAVGFKGQSWEAKFPYPPEHEHRPCYFGMCVDSFDNFTSDRIALGYASPTRGSCVREMVSKDIVGAPTDVDYKILSKTSVERSADRTVVRFTVSQRWPHGFNFDGYFRVMWAIGKVSGGEGCSADIGYHGVNRGVAPVNWLLKLGSLPCKYNPYEMGEMVSTDVIFA